MEFHLRLQLYWLGQYFLELAFRLRSLQCIHILWIKNYLKLFREVFASPWRTFALCESFWTIIALLLQTESENDHSLKAQLSDVEQRYLIC